LALYGLRRRQAVDRLPVADHGELRALVVELLEHLLADLDEWLARHGIQPLVFGDIVHTVFVRQAAGVDLARRALAAVLGLVPRTVVLVVGPVVVLTRCLGGGCLVGDRRIREQQALPLGDAVAAPALREEVLDGLLQHRDVSCELLDLAVPVGDRGACFRELLPQSLVLDS
jgi:hypothetical protein